MISFLSDGFSQIISMFMGWFGHLNTVAQDMTSKTAGGVLTVIASLAVAGLGAWFIVHFVQGVMSMVSNDNYPMMNHVKVPWHNLRSSSLRDGEALGGFLRIGWRLPEPNYHRRYTDNAILEESSADAVVREVLERLSEGEPPGQGLTDEMLYSIYGSIWDGIGPRSAASSMAMTLTQSGVLLRKGFMMLDGRRGGEVIRNNVFHKSDGPEEIIATGQDGEPDLFVRLSGNVYRPATYEERYQNYTPPWAKEKSGEGPIDTTGHTVGDGEYIGPA